MSIKLLKILLILIKNEDNLVLIFIYTKNELIHLFFKYILNVFVKYTIYFLALNNKLIVINVNSILFIIL